MSKGLGLFVCSVVASLPLMTVFNTTPEAWQANLFWVLQVFIQCALLGLVAFDYTTMRRNGYDWQMLLEIHGLTGVGVQVSSILTAAGMAVVTLMTTQASTLVTLALKFVLPQVPADLPIP
jgi:peptidoglycan/LPS O-acetylase OafA/YrhL